MRESGKMASCTVMDPETGEQAAVNAPDDATPEEQAKWLVFARTMVENASRNREIAAASRARSDEKAKRGRGTFGANLADALEERRMTQKELARRAGVTEAAVSRYLTGERAPQAATVAALARALDCSTDDLLGAPKSGPEKARMRFARNLTAAMAAHGMSVGGLAEAAGLSQAAVSRYVNGRRAPKTDAAAAVAKALGTTVDALYGTEADADELDAAVALVVANAGTLSRGQRKTLAFACLGIPED